MLFCFRVEREEMTVGVSPKVLFRWVFYKCSGVPVNPHREKAMQHRDSSKSSRLNVKVPHYASKQHFNVRETRKYLIFSHQSKQLPSSQSVGVLNELCVMLHHLPLHHQEVKAGRCTQTTANSRSTENPSPSVTE